MLCPKHFLYPLSLCFKLISSFLNSVSNPLRLLTELILNSLWFTISYPVPLHIPTSDDFSTKFTKAQKLEKAAQICYSEIKSIKSLSILDPVLGTDTDNAQIVDIRTVGRSGQMLNCRTENIPILRRRFWKYYVGCVCNYTEDDL